MAGDNVDSRIDAIGQDIARLSDGHLDDGSRKKLFEIVSQATSKLEPPIETIWRIIMSPHAPAALMVVIKMGVLQDLVQAKHPKTAQELCESCGRDKLVIVRMMRPLVAQGIFRETDIETYESTAISQMLVTPPLVGGYQFMFDLATRSLANLPRFLAKTNYKHVNGHPGPFQDCNQTDDGMFQHLIKNPVMMSNFNKFMSGALETRPDWFKTFPVDEILLAGALDSKENTLLVDVGGGEGHDISAFHQAFPNVQAKLILQDLPPVIDNIKSLDSAIIQQKHDFFTPQPVHGARAYYFRNIFHDWHDEGCITILRQTAAAMTRGYSKLLIFEFLLSAYGVPLYPALLDINMMALLNGMERTEAQWTALLAKGGFKVIRFHKHCEDAEGLIEAELA